MTRLAPVSHAELVRPLREFGLEGPYSGGKHLFMAKGDLRLTIPKRNGRRSALPCCRGYSGRRVSVATIGLGKRKG